MASQIVRPQLELEGYSVFKMWVLRVESTVSAVLLVALYLLLIIQVFFRYVLNSPLGWTEELSRFTFVWMVFISSAYLAGRNSHIAVTFLCDWLPPRYGSWAVRVAAAVVTAAAAVIAVASIGFVAATAELVSPGVGVPMGWIYAAATVGFLLVALHMVEYLITGQPGARQEELAKEDAR